MSDWHDLGYPIDARSPRVVTFPPPAVGRLMSMPADPMNVSELTLCCHVGTHVDAPSHFVPGAPSIGELPLDRFCGPGVVLPVRVRPNGLIEVADIRAAGATLRGGTSCC